MFKSFLPPLALTLLAEAPQVVSLLIPLNQIGWNIILSNLSSPMDFSNVWAKSWLRAVLCPFVWLQCLLAGLVRGLVWLFRGFVIRSNVRVWSVLKLCNVRFPVFWDGNRKTSCQHLAVNPPLLPMSWGWWVVSVVSGVGVRVGFI